MYILITILVLLAFIIYMKYDSIKELIIKIKNNYQTIKNIEGIKSQMSDLENSEILDNHPNNDKKVYNEKIQQFYDIVSLKHFDIFDNLSNLLNYLYEQYLLPIYYKNFYVNIKKEI
jgi:predicted PurR-regulated permease PerM